jgi:hypothetical protein
MSRPPSIDVAFCIEGRDLFPADVTEAVGLEPTKVWHATHPTVISDSRMSTVNWIVGREKLAIYSTDEAVRTLLEVVWPHREAILQYLRTSNTSASLTCYVTIWEDRPVYDLSADTMSRLAVLDCEFGMDIQ